MKHERTSKCERARPDPIYATGLRARGGFEIDMTWRDGELAQVTVKSLKGRPLSLLYRNKVLNLPTELGASHTFGPMLDVKK